MQRKEIQRQRGLDLVPQLMKVLWGTEEEADGILESMWGGGGLSSREVTRSKQN